MKCKANIIYSIHNGGNTIASHVNIANVTKKANSSITTV